MVSSIRRKDCCTSAAEKSIRSDISGWSSAVCSAGCLERALTRFESNLATGSWMPRMSSRSSRPRLSSILASKDSRLPLLQLQVSFLYYCRNSWECLGRTSLGWPFGSQPLRWCRSGMWQAWRGLRARMQSLACRGPTQGMCNRNAEVEKCVLPCLTKLVSLALRLLVGFSARTGSRYFAVPNPHRVLFVFSSKLWGRCRGKRHPFRTKADADASGEFSSPNCEL